MFYKKMLCKKLSELENRVCVIGQLAANSALVDNSHTASGSQGGILN
jgi:hypothetical protein